MSKVVSYLSLQYGVALLAAPAFCLLYITIFEDQSIDIFWFLTDKKALFLLVLFYPIVEELAFRGVIQEYIDKKIEQNLLFFHLSAANIITSIFFVLMHFIHHAPMLAILTFFPSLIFGYFKDQYKFIMPSIVLHMFYNFCYFSLITSTS